MAEPTLRQLLLDSERMAAAAELAATRKTNGHTPFERAFAVLEQVLEGARNGRGETVKGLASALSAVTKAIGGVLDRTETELHSLRAAVARVEARLDGTTQLPDRLYGEFEENFRGDWRDVLRRHHVYLPWLEELQARHPNALVYEIGPGRGEMGGLVTQKGLKWLGVESNAHQVQTLQRKGLDAKVGDAWTELAAQPDGGLGGIVALHVIEHVPLGKLVELFELAKDKLEPGGVLILETPNWKSLTSLTNFYLDPTHLRPVDGRLLEFTARSYGFDVLLCEAVEPAGKLEKVPESAAHAAALNRNFELLNGLLFPGQDLAFVARRP